MPKPLSVWITTNLKILHMMGIPDHLTCLLRNLYANQEATIRIGLWNNGLVQNWERSISRLYIVTLPIYLICRVHHAKCRLNKAQAGIKIARRNISNLTYVDDTNLIAESEEEPKGLLMKVKEESEKAGLKLNVQKMKIMASSPIISWEIDGETVETLSDFIFWGSKITADGDYSH